MAYDYAAVARQYVILCQYAMTGGSFDVVLADILTRATATNPVFAYRDGSQTYSVLHDESGLNFIVVSSEGKLPDATAFLQRLRRTFLTTPSVREWRDSPAYGLQNEFSDQIHEMIVAANTPPEVPGDFANDSRSSERDALLPIAGETLGQRPDLFPRERPNVLTRECLLALWTAYRYRIFAGLVLLLLVIVLLASVL
jgi:hypothetical protein